MSRLRVDAFEALTAGDTFTLDDVLPMASCNYYHDSIQLFMSFNMSSVVDFAVGKVYHYFNTDFDAADYATQQNPDSTTNRLARNANVATITSATNGSYAVGSKELMSHEYTTSADVGKRDLRRDHCMWFGDSA